MDLKTKEKRRSKKNTPSFDKIVDSYKSPDYSVCERGYAPIVIDYSPEPIDVSKVDLVVVVRSIIKVDISRLRLWIRKVQPSNYVDKVTNKYFPLKISYQDTKRIFEKANVLKPPKLRYAFLEKKHTSLLITF